MELHERYSNTVYSVKNMMRYLARQTSNPEELAEEIANMFGLHQWNNDGILLPWAQEAWHIENLPGNPWMETAHIRAAMA